MFFPAGVQKRAAGRDGPGGRIGITAILMRSSRVTSVTSHRSNNSQHAKTNVGACPARGAVGQLYGYRRRPRPDLNHVVTQEYVSVFMRLYLVHTQKPWLKNRLKRLAKSPKLHFYDANLFAAMRDVFPEVLCKDKTSVGAILETSVFSELRKIATWSEQRCNVSHFRDKEKNEVDIVLENRRGDLFGIEVKSSATVSGSDFSGMRTLADASGKKFVQGIVLYDHGQVVPFGANMFAAPLSCLWGANESRRGTMRRKYY